MFSLNAASGLTYLHSLQIYYNVFKKSIYKKAILFSGAAGLISRQTAFGLLDAFDRIGDGAILQWYSIWSNIPFSSEKTKFNTSSNSVDLL